MIILKKKFSIDIDEITPLFTEKLALLKPIPVIYDRIAINILKIINKIKYKSSISKNKIIECYKNKYNIILHKTTVYRKLRNKLKYCSKKLL